MNTDEWLDAERDIVCRYGHVFRGTMRDARHGAGCPTCGHHSGAKPYTGSVSRPWAAEPAEK